MNEGHVNVISLNMISKLLSLQDVFWSIAALFEKTVNLQQVYLTIIFSDLLQEFFSARNDASLFLFGSHSKKRPHNLVIGMSCFFSNTV